MKIYVTILFFHSIYSFFFAVANDKSVIFPTQLVWIIQFRISNKNMHKHIEKLVGKIKINVIPLFPNIILIKLSKPFSHRSKKHFFYSLLI